MRNVNMIVQLDIITNHGVIECSSRYRAIRANLDRISDYDAANVRERYRHTFFVVGETKPACPNGRIWLDYAIISDPGRTANNTILPDEASVSDRYVGPDTNARPNADPHPDHGCWINRRIGRTTNNLRRHEELTQG